MPKLVPVTSDRTVKGIIKNNNLNFEHPIQRKSKQWDIERKSKLIHSILYGYPVDALLSVEIDGNPYIIIDGKQRATSVLEFFKNEFPLHANTPKIGDEVIAGKTFSELTEEQQDDIKDFQFRFHIYKNLTDEEIEELFLRRNGGQPLNKIQLTRVKAGKELREFIIQLGEMSFFKNSIQIADSQRNKSIDEELILQVVCLVVNNEPVNLGSKFLEEFALRIRQEGLSEEMQQTITKTTEYLGEAFPEKYKELKKSLIPVLFMTAIQAQKDNIPASKFGGLIQQFFAYRKKERIVADDYGNSLSGGGTAKKEKVADRLNALMNEYKNNINDALDYQLSKPKENVAEQEATNNEQQEQITDSEQDQENTPKTLSEFENEVEEQLNQDQDQQEEDQDQDLEPNEQDIKNIETEMEQEQDNNDNSQDIIYENDLFQDQDNNQELEKDVINNIENIISGVA